MAKKAPAKPAAKRKPRAKKPVQPDSPFELSEFSEETKKRLAEILDAKESEQSLKSSSLWRRLMLVGAVVAGLAVSFGGGVWSAGGINIGPKPKHDAVSAVFDAQESAFRKYSGELATKLKSGEFASEDAAKNWMTEKYIPDSEAAWTVLLTKEAAAFGGKDWTAEKHAAFIEGYAR